MMIGFPLKRLHVLISVFTLLYVSHPIDASHDPSPIANLTESIPSVVNSSDCSLSATINTDLEICEEQTIDLDANITGDYESFEWTSTEGYSNTSDLDPSVLVSTTTTFTFTATGLSGVNAVVNGDFSSGFTGFTSEYVYNPNTNTNGLGQGSFNLDVQTPNLWTNCSPIDGEMMVVNGATVLNEEVYCTTIAVCPNTDYQLSADVMNINNPAPILQFSANGVLLGSPITGGGECNVEQFFDVWNSGSDTSLEMCIVNQSTVAGGNDFALDNISIEEICTLTEQFEVIVHSLEIGVQDSPHVDCNQPTAIVAPIFTGGPITGYNWTTSDGNIIFGTIGPSIEVDQAGEYFVDLSYGHNCVKTTSIIVTEDFVAPDVFINDPIAIDCNFSASAINVIGEPDYTYFWVLPDGSISFQEDLPTLTLIGDYAVTVTDQTNGCTEAWLVEIEEDLDTIPLNIAVSNNLDCITQVANLSLQTSETPQTIQWSNGLDDFNIDVDAAGNYSVIITANNGCTSTQTVEVEDNSIEIEYNISIADTLTCTLDSINLFTTIITEDVAPQWTQAGAIVDSDTIVATQSDWYYLTLTADNGCEELDSIFIEIDTVIPAYGINSDTLRCNTPTITLSIDSDSILSAIWVTPLNDVVTQDILSTNLPGEYQVYVSGLNGCIDSTSVTVNQAANFPEIMIAGLDTLTCLVSQVDLSASVSLPTVLAEWTSPDNTTTTLTDISLTEPGTYLYSVETSDGCKSSQEVVVLIDTLSPAVDFTPLTILDCDITSVTNSFILSEEISANWYQGGQIISTDNTVVNDTEGMYTLEITGENGCVQEYPYEVTIDTLSPTLDVVFNSIDCITLAAEVTVNTDGDNYTIEQSNQGLIVNNQAYNTTEAGMVTVIVENANGCTTTESISIEIDTLSPDVLVDVVQPITCVTETVLPDVITSDIGLIYDWTGPNGFESDQTEPSLTVAGDYSLLVTSDNGCTALASIQVQIDTISPNVDISVDLPLTCVNESVLPNVTSIGNNLTYSWTGPQSFDSDQSEPLLTEAGGYSLLVTNNENGCTDLASIQVQIDTLSPIVNAVVDQSINCTVTEVSPNVTTSVNGLTFSWTGPNAYSSDQSEPNLSEAGDYSVLVTNAENGCTDQASIAVLIDTLSPSITVDITQPFNCVNLVIFPDVIYTGTDLTYEWQGPNNFQSDLPIPMLTDDGAYSIEVTALNGCTTLSAFEIARDTALIAPIVLSDNLTCDNPMVTLSLVNSADYFAVQWINLDSGEIQTEASILVNEASNYQVIGIQSNGCQVTESLEVLDLKDELQLSILPDEIVLTCEVVNIILTTSIDDNSVEYLWSSDVIGFNDSSPQITVTEPGIYNVIVTDVNGCTGGQSIQITEDITPPNPTVELTPYDCNTESNQINITAEQGDLIYFNSVVSSDGMFAISENETNSLSILVEGINGCTFDTLINYQVFEFLTLSTIDTVTIDESGMTQLTVTHNRDEDEIVSISWNPSEGLSCDDCLDPIYSLSESQELVVTVTDIYGCVETAVIFLLFEEAQIEVDIFVANIYLPFDDPSGDKFKALTNAENILSVDLVNIYDRWGNLIFTQNDLEYSSPDYGWDGTFNGATVEQGVYVYLFQLTLVTEEVTTIVGDVTLVR